MTQTTSDINTPSPELLDRWHSPHPAFSSGNDPRSSESGLLMLFYGSLHKASRYNWLNAGRTLVDKTFLRILWAAEELEPLSISFDEVASRVDAFIRQQITPIWDELDELDHEARHQLATKLVEQAATGLFGSQTNETAASRLMFFLCPQLPIFPISAGHLQVAMQQCPNAAIDGYASYHNACRGLLAHSMPKVYPQLPQSQSDCNNERLAISQLLSQSDWWPRRVLSQQLKDQGPTLGLSPEAFCRSSDAGLN